MALFVLSFPVPKASAELQELTATVEQVLTINIPSALNFDINEIDEQWHEIPFQVGISSNNRTGYTFVSDIATSMQNTRYGKSITLDKQYSITYPVGVVKETSSHASYPNSDNSALDKKYDYKLRVLADSHVTNGTYTGAMSFFATSNPVPSTIAYIEYLDEISNDIVLTMTPGKFYQLKDRRDGKKYWIIFENGEVKMAQNLDYNISNSVALTKNNTNISNSFIYANTTITGSDFDEDWVESADTPQSYDEGIIYRPSEEDAYTTISACVRDGYSEWECYRSAGGNYYNWSAAVASNDTSEYNEEYVAVQDICPKNWQLPVTAADGFLSATMPSDKAAAGRIRCQGIKPSHRVNIIVDNYYQDPIYRVKNNTAWGITSVILPKDFEYSINNSYELAGWSTHPNDRVPDYVKGGLFETDQEEVNLYAVWRAKPLDLNDITYMQEMTSAIIKNTPSRASKQLIDSRDGKKYWVTKVASSRIMMTQNLDYDLPPIGQYTTFSKLDSDVVSDIQYYRNSSYYDFEGGDYYFADGTTKTPITDFTEDDVRWHYHIGNYYSVYTAKLGNWSENNYDNVRYSICPKGWGIPTTKEASTYFLWDSMYIIKAGYLTSKDIVSYEGTQARYLLNDYYGSSSFAYTNGNMRTYDYGFEQSSASGANNAYSIRCIARDDFDVNNPTTPLLDREY